MRKSAVRVLVVDDYELWQTLVHMRLNEESNLHVIAVAADGVEAVQKAGALQPNLILLDVSLPKVNGIEAARQIREVAPQSKILFLSSDADPDVVKAAFRAGGLGYIHKSEAAIYLLEGIEAVLDGKRYVRCRMMGLEDLA